MNPQASTLGLTKPMKNQASTFIGRMASEGDGLHNNKDTTRQTTIAKNPYGELTRAQAAGSTSR